MNPNLLENSREFNARKPQNELVTSEARRRLEIVTPAIREGRDAAVATIIQAESVFLKQQGRVATQTTVANAPQRQEQVQQYENPAPEVEVQPMSVQVAPQQQPERRGPVAEAPQAPATPPPFDLQARIAQLQLEAQRQAQGGQDMIGQLGKAA